MPFEAEENHTSKNAGPPNSGEYSISVHPETMRIIAYVNFWIMVIVAIILTNVYVAPEHDLANSMLVQTFGYNNICIYWDYSPPLYVAAMIYPFVEMPLFFYILLNWLRVRKRWKQGLIGTAFFRISSLVSFTELVLLSWFRMVFIVMGDVSIAGHTFGFLALQIALNMNAVHNLAFYRKTHRFGKKTLAIGGVYVGLLIAITLTKIVISQSVIWGYPLYDIHSAAQVEFAKTVDLLWMIFAAVIPFFIAMISRRRTEGLTITI